MFSKVPVSTKILFVISIISIIACFILQSYYERKLDKELKDKDKELRKEYSETIKALNKEVSDYKEEIETLSGMAETIKYVPYEKYRYVDRDLDYALDVVAKYRYDPGPKETGTGNIHSGKDN